MDRTNFRTYCDQFGPVERLEYIDIDTIEWYDIGSREELPVMAERRSDAQDVLLRFDNKHSAQAYLTANTAHEYGYVYARQLREATNVTRSA